jgi:hypothetical protein
MEVDPTAVLRVGMLARHQNLVVRAMATPYELRCERSSKRDSGTVRVGYTVAIRFAATASRT